MPTEEISIYGEPMASLMWFRRDLRLESNEACATATDDDRSTALFVIDPHLWNRSGQPARAWLHSALRELAGQLDGALVCKFGDPVDVVPAMARAVAATRVVATADVTAVSRQRDSAVARALDRDGAELHLVGSPYAHPPGEITTSQGRGYQVFTPYYRQWAELPATAPPDADPSSFARPNGVADDDIPTSEPAEDDTPGIRPAPGRSAALDAATEFLDRAEHYLEQRDDPGADATSRLSAALHFGTLHPAELLERLDPSDRGHVAFARQLAWRDFYAQCLHARPETAWEDLRSEAVVPTDSGPRARARFDAWRAGQTGYPFVDAGMRQLLEQGWMHNRLRMVTASFLVKDLHLDWRWGARHFLDHLVDRDIANNNQGWQWVAGTGTDASPYHRIFNPSTQSRRFDPDGTYIRRWVPELADLGDDEVHDPPASNLFSGDYPPRIVDHATERTEALARLKSLRS